jgi:hypothetical protein
MADQRGFHGSYYEVTPHRVMAWVDFPRDVTRFDFLERH